MRSLEEVLNGIKKGAVGDRAEYCVGRVESALGFALGRYFVRETFGGDSRRVATKVITGTFVFDRSHIVISLMRLTRHHWCIQEVLEEA